MYILTQMQIIANTWIIAVVTCLLIGLVLNRFSKDVGFMDSLLPYTSVEFLAVSCVCIEKLFYQGLCLGSHDYCLWYNNLPWSSKVCEQETKELFHLKAMQECFIMCT